MKNQELIKNLNEFMYVLHIGSAVKKCTYFQLMPRQGSSLFWYILNLDADGPTLTN